ncbi:GNAT family N-acetyltransferase [Psychrobacter lutiphocae]|uniref:GNAT family N-acetyltransferase n=1 Tax=Psychrobacter lutiphocae TaxID=540500 RepID=UPI0012EA15B9|nr:GNAT family N-acetyltransferase [Psychrobacter lutiphocae]
MYRAKIVSGTKYSIVKAQALDLEQIVKIYNQSILTKKATADLTPVSIKDRQVWFDTHQQRPERPIYVIKNQDDQVMAWGCFSDVKDRSAYHISAEISIYVHSSFQRRGLASHLLQWMLDQAPELGIYNILALIFAHNEPSLALFSNFGFTIWGKLPQVCDMQTFIADIVIMGKQLAASTNIVDAEGVEPINH